VNVVSVDRIRARFPALARREAGRHVAYFDGPGGTQVPESVARAVTDYLLHHNANTHWAYTTSAETDTMLEEARGALADLLHCDPHEVVFGANMSTLTLHLARAIGRGLAPGDEIVVTRLDHQANVAPWQALAVERGVTIRTVPFRGERGTLDPDAFREAVTSATRVIAVGAASNALGTVTDLLMVMELARSVGALVFVDAVHYTPHLLPDVQALGCDALACSPYKFYGPHVGCLYLRRELIESLDVPRLVCAPDTAPERFETGTLCHEGIVGAGAAVDFLASLAHPGPREPAERRARLGATYAELHRRGGALLERLWEGLARMRGVTLYGPPPGPRRTSTLAFTLRGHDPADVTRHLCRNLGVYVSHGDFYASTVVDDLGLDRGGLVRAGAACYTTPEEVDRLIQGVAELVGA
jgi:cysteine desulfurase family protein (TIGR01976 family)